MSLKYFVGSIVRSNIKQDLKIRLIMFYIKVVNFFHPNNNVLKLVSRINYIETSKKIQVIEQKVYS